MSFHHALRQSRRLPPQRVEQKNFTAVSFDALQSKYAVLLFKTLSIRLNEACVSCLCLACEDVLYFLACLKCTPSQANTFIFDVNVLESEPLPEFLNNR